MPPVDDNSPNGAGEPALDPAMLARAEQAIAAHGKGFRDTVREQVRDMKRLTDTLAATPPAGTETETAAWNALFRHGHVLAGQGGTFGFPLLSEIGRSLCDFIDTRSGEISASEIAVLHAHIAATSRALEQPSTAADKTPSLLSDLQNLVRRHRT